MTTKQPEFSSQVVPNRQAGYWHRTRTTFSNAMIITRREVTDSFRDWRIMAPIFIMTLLFPAISQFGAQVMFNFVTQYGAEVVGERSIPFLLMIVGFFPVSLSLVIALETFVGEKERRSLEPLLSTPLSNLELYIGKTIAAMIPPLAASYAGMGIYLSSLLFGDLAWRPAAMLIVQIILLSTAQGLLMVTGAVIISSQTTSTRAANLLASFIIVPMSLLVILESIIMFSAPDANSPNGILALWVILVGLLIGTILFMRIGTRIFNREELLASAIDTLNLRWIARTFWRAFRGEAHSGILQWFRDLYSVLPRLRNAIWAVLFAFVLTFVIGWGIGTYSSWKIPPGLASSQEEIATNFRMMYELGVQPSTVILALLQNIRVLFLGMFLGIFSFGVLPIVFSIAPFGILGWVFAQLTALNMNSVLFFAAIIPHGLFEIPAIVIATAASLRLGAIITQRPPLGKTVGDMWLLAAADAVKTFVGIVLPLLILAALVEVYITPLAVRWVIGG